MAGLLDKKLTKIIGLKKEEFNNHIKSGEIKLSRSKLIPKHKFGDELALTSIFLSAIKYVTEFRQQIFSEPKISPSGKIYCYTEITFPDFPNSRIDGLILVVKGGVIKDAMILEVKSNKSCLEKDQLERYQPIAKHYSITRFMTISNEFVSDITQSPAGIKSTKKLEMYHYSWTYILTIAYLLLFKNEKNIADHDQKEIMREVVSYLETNKSGVLRHERMSKYWVDLVEKINKRQNLRSDPALLNGIRSWQEQERDMALCLSRNIGRIVECGERRYKGNLKARLDDDSKSLLNTEEIKSVFRIKDAPSNITTKLIFDKRTIEMSIFLKAPDGKTAKGQIGWLKRQLNNCLNKEGNLFSTISKDLCIDFSCEGLRGTQRVGIKEIDTIPPAGVKKIKEFSITFISDLGSKFSSPSKFAEISESMLIDFYTGIIQHVKKWEPEAPKMKEEKPQDNEETFIDIPDLNHNVYYYHRDNS